MDRLLSEADCVKALSRLEHIMSPLAEDRPRFRTESLRPARFNGVYPGRAPRKPGYNLMGGLTLLYGVSRNSSRRRVVSIVRRVSIRLVWKNKVLSRSCGGPRARRGGTFCCFNFRELTPFGRIGTIVARLGRGFTSSRRTLRGVGGRTRFVRSCFSGSRLGSSSDLSIPFGGSGHETG